MTRFFQKKQAKSLAIGFVSLFVVLIGYGAFHYSKANRINAYLQARSSGSGQVLENIKEYLVWADTNEQLTNDQARYTSFKRYSKAELVSKRQQLQTATAADDMYVKSVGRKFLIFPDYRIAVKPVALTIKTNVPNVDILLNHKKIAVSQSEDFSTTIERLPAADYRASINGYYKDRKIKVSKTYDGKNHTLDLRVTFKTFTVTSNVRDGELYVDGERVETLKAGQLQLEEYPVTETAKAYIKKTFPDGELTSSKHALAPVAEGSQLEINIDHLLTEEQAGQVLVAAFDQLLTYLNQGQDPAGPSPVFEQGANNAFYKGLKDSIKAKFQTDTRKASRLSIPSILLSKLTQIGKQSYLVDFTAVYDFVYDKETDPEKGTSGNVRQDLTGKLTLKKSGDSYLVSQSGPKNITVASEKNQVKPSIFPEGLVGTWIGHRSDMTFTMILAKDGSITTTIGNKNGNGSQTTKSAKITKVEEKGDGLFLYTVAPDADIAALVPGGGLGGVNVKYAFGVKWSGDVATIVVWQTANNAAFDYSKPMLGPDMKKQ